VKTKALFAGCSLTADCGFSQVNQSKLWVNILTNKFDLHTTNIAIGGMSNEEIYYRSVEAIITNPPDIVIVMWSHIERMWQYFENNNIDDFTILNYDSVSGLLHDVNAAKIYSKLHYANFNNRYIKIKHWLLNIISLESVLTLQSIPYVFVKGFENSLQDIQAVTYSQGFENLSDDIKSMIDFDDRPDHYLLEKLNSIQHLVTQVKKFNWANFGDDAFVDTAVDLSDDNAHPGPNTNFNLAQKLSPFVEIAIGKLHSK
jgi:hypothetical protein